MGQTNNILKNAFFFIKSSRIFKIVLIFEVIQGVYLLSGSTIQAYGLVGWQFPFIALFNFTKYAYWLFSALAIAFFVLPIETGNAGLLFSRGYSRGRWFAERYIVTLIAFILLILTAIIVETLCVTIVHGFRIPEEMKNRYVPTLLIYLSAVFVFFNLFLSLHFLIGTLLQRSVLTAIVVFPVTYVDYYIYLIWGGSGKPVKHILGYFTSKAMYLLNSVTSGSILQLDFWGSVIMEFAISIIVIIISLNLFKRMNL